MSKMVCSEIGEIDRYKLLPGCQLVRDVVTAVTGDTIVYPHVSSCIGLIFELPGAPHGIDRVGAHFVVSGPYGFGFDKAVEYYGKNRILRQYCVNSNVYCFTPMAQWADPVVGMLRSLGVSQYYFHETDEDEVNAWVNQNYLRLTPYASNSNAAAQSLTPLGSVTVKNLNGVAWIPV